MKRFVKIFAVFFMALLVTSCGQNMWETHYEAGMAYLDDNNYEEAIAEFTVAIEAEAERPEAYVKRADANVLIFDQTESDTDEVTVLLNNAENDYLKSLELDDTNIQVYQSLAAVYDKQNRLENAIDIAEEGYSITDNEELSSLAKMYENILTDREFKEFFYNNFSDSDKVILADITHDDKKEMLVIHQSGDSEMLHSELTVYRYDRESGVCGIDFTYAGDNDHVGGFFNCYIREDSDGYAVLGRESFGMWQGMGKLMFEEYYLDNEGNKVEVNTLVLDSDDAGKHDESGVVTTEAIDEYHNSLKALGKEFKVVYATYSEGLGECEQIETNPKKVFAEE